MGQDICIFKRIEKKYIVTKEQHKALLSIIKGRLSSDKFPKNTILNIYLDTSDFLMIRNSIEATSYKEKLRLRSYGTPDDDSKVFLEIKKKYKGVVYKRREVMTLEEARRYIDNGIKPFDSQIMREIDYMMFFYNKPKPAVVLSYEREAYFASEDPSLRITFDTAPRFRADDLMLEHGSSGREILPLNNVLMEIKTNVAMPLWLAHALDECGILPASFSKYGTAYRIMCRENEIKQFNIKGEYENASNF